MELIFEPITAEACAGDDEAELLLDHRSLEIDYHFNSYPRPTTVIEAELELAGPAKPRFVFDEDLDV